MLTIRHDQLAALGAAMRERFIDEETVRLQPLYPALAPATLRARVAALVAGAGRQGIHAVGQVRLYLDDSLAREGPAHTAAS